MIPQPTVNPLEGLRDAGASTNTKDGVDGEVIGMTGDLPQRCANTAGFQRRRHAGLVRLTHDLGHLDPPTTLSQCSGCEEAVTAVVSAADEYEDALCGCPVRHHVPDGPAEEQFQPRLGFSLQTDFHSTTAGELGREDAVRTWHVAVKACLRYYLRDLLSRETKSFAR